MTPEYDWQTEAMHKHEAKRFFSVVGFGLLALLVVTEMAQILLVYATKWLYPWALDAWWYSWILSFLPLYGVGLPTLLWTTRQLPVTPYAEPFVRMRTGKWFVLLLICMGYMYIGSIAGQWLLDIISSVTGREYTNDLNVLIDQSPWWVTLVGTVILAPLGEEFLFRKVVIDRTRRYGDTVSILLSATFFALFHGNLYQLFYAFLIGLVLGYLYTRTGKLRWSVTMHMAVNAMGGLIMPRISSRLLSDEILSLEGDALAAYMAEHPDVVLGVLLMNALIYGLIVAAVVLTAVFRRRLVLRKNPIPMTRDSLVSGVLSAGGIAVAMACFVLVIILNML